MPMVKGLWLFIGAGSVASVALGQTTCLRPIGPDVVVGSLMAGNNGNDTTGPTQNYTATATHDAFSMGTYSCNVGNTPVAWFQNTNQHPVIAQSVYKYKVAADGAGRFEQIGQSWLKHGFFALSDNLCCNGCQGFPNGDHLGISCSDPYTAARNGSQTQHIGPKWQVNAYTGNFSYPPASPGGTFTSVSRRMAIPLTDLEPTAGTVQYFGEGQYVAPDDAAAGNQFNNASYRRVFVTGGPTDYTFSFNSGAGNGTVRETSAIHAWTAIDSAVTESIFRIPSEGRIIVSSRATPIAGGRYHYEYMVYNMNSDLCVGTFSVPLPDSAVVTNIGFKDVEYRDGDGIANVNIDGTDWAGTRSNGRITWGAPSFATNANGNAIRWATAYTFRFDADVAPAPSGNATISTWKTVASYDVPAQVPAGGTCYADCDANAALNVNDFVCFQNLFASSSPQADCNHDSSLNVNDFICFQNAFAAGCR